MKKLFLTSVVVGTGYLWWKFLKRSAQNDTNLSSKKALPIEKSTKDQQLPVSLPKDQGVLIKTFTDQNDTDSMRITDQRQAIDWVQCHFGDNHGDWQWSCIWSNETGYFVKATSQQLQLAGSMTGTAMSVMVKKNGQLDWTF
ncbi:hypothetical protein [Liquorilactobacillus sicerae]|uniref:hypothetical protein n=1 Tax=Liquorilactobacillus sicerae TaxID=1416943 RepID=UPI0024813486|nr:hypothetical protein [Liquorilactobacillus sicerae]